MTDATKPLYPGGGPKDNLSKDKTKCLTCGASPAFPAFNPWFWYCNFHKRVWTAAGKASLSNILIIKNNEYYDYKTDLLAAYIEREFKPLAEAAALLDELAAAANNEDMHLEDFVTAAHWVAQQWVALKEGKGDGE